MYRSMHNSTQWSWTEGAVKTTVHGNTNTNYNVDINLKTQFNIYYTQIGYEKLTQYQFENLSLST